MFKPVNRYILVDLLKNKETPESLIVLPDDYKPIEEKHAKVVVVSAASDARFTLEKGAHVIVDRSMIEEINISDTIYNVILDNYVVGIVE